MLADLALPKIGIEERKKILQELGLKNINKIKNVKKIAKPFLEKAPPSEVLVKVLPSDPHRAFKL